MEEANRWKRPNAAASPVTYHSPTYLIHWPARAIMLVRGSHGTGKTTFTEGLLLGRNVCRVGGIPSAVRFDDSVHALVLENNDPVTRPEVLDIRQWLNRQPLGLVVVETPMFVEAGAVRAFDIVVECAHDNAELRWRLVKSRYQDKYDDGIIAPPPRPDRAAV